VWDPGDHDESWRAVWAYSAQRVAKGYQDADPAGGPGHGHGRRGEGRTHPRFVKTSNGARMMGCVTNIPVELMPAGEVIGSYEDPWQVEASLGMSKSDLRARPIFHPPVTRSRPT
jgi:hypothetical protein